MNSQHKGPILYIVLMAAFILSFGLGRYTAKPETIVEERERIDTLVIRDTFTHYVPQYVHKHTRDTIRVPVPVPGPEPEPERDTIYVSLPKETRVYEDARYRAEVSGYQPSLDRIDIYTQTQVVTKDVTQVVKQKTRWGLGISAGYGVTINTTDQTFRPAPYIGVGIHYNLISW
jgi:hypothetical protein